MFRNLHQQIATEFSEAQELVEGLSYELLYRRRDHLARYHKIYRLENKHKWVGYRKKYRASERSKLLRREQARRYRNKKKARNERDRVDT